MTIRSSWSRTLHRVSGKLSFYNTRREVLWIGSKNRCNDDDDNLVDYDQWSWWIIIIIIIIIISTSAVVCKASLTGQAALGRFLNRQNHCRQCHHHHRCYYHHCLQANHNMTNSHHVVNKLIMILVGFNQSYVLLVRPHSDCINKNHLQMDFVCHL